MTDTTASDPGAPPELRPYSGVEYVFEPHARTLPPVGPYLRDAWDRRHFVVAMAKANLRGPRSRTGLGELWAIVDPLFQAFIYWFLINTIRSTPGKDANARLIILVSGLFLWTFSTTVLGGGGRSIIRNKNLMLNTQFPRILLPAVEVYKGLLDLGPYMAVYAVIHVLVLRGPIGPGIFLLPLLILIQVGISAGLALVFATLTVYVSDMSNVLDYVQRILFFTTPILYPVSALPSSATAILQLNPFFAIFACYQAVMTGGLPSAIYVIEAAAWSIGLLVFGFRIFVSNERGFALRL